MIDRLRVVITIVACWSIATCSDPTAPDPLGQWGGEGASAVVTATLTQFEFDCAHGELEGVLALDAQGRFSAEGVYVREGGPNPAEGRQPITASYDVMVEGNRMTLHVLPEGSDAIAIHELCRGREPFLRKCL